MIPTDMSEHCQICGTHDDHTPIVSGGRFHGCCVVCSEAIRRAEMIEDEYGDDHAERIA